MAKVETKPAGYGCYTLAVTNPNKIWNGDNVLANHLPLLCVQIAYNILASRFIYYAFRPIHMPFLVAQILAGFLLSPFLLGRTAIFRMLYREAGVLPVETYAHLGIMYCVFLSGVEMNSDAILRSRKKATSIAVAGIIFPMLMGIGFLALHQKIYRPPPNVPAMVVPARKVIAQGYLFWCLALSVTGFPVLARVLAELKLLYTRLGRATLSAAMVIDAYGWVLLTLLIPFSSTGGKPIFSVLSTLMFILFCLFVLRPLLAPIIERKTRDETWDNKQLLAVLMGTFVCSFITELFGTHPIVGAFVFGLILPHGKFADLLLDMTHDFVTGVISPLYFAGCGLRLNLMLIVQQKYWPLILLLVLLLSIPKVLSSLVATFFFGIPARDGMCIGLLLNTKGVMALILLNFAWDKKILDKEVFSVMMLAIIIMTAMVSPMINAIYKPKFRFKQSQLRTIQKLRVDAELRVVACVHNARQATGMISVLQATNATRISPLHVFTLHLVELTRHGTALLASQMDKKPNNHVAAQNTSGSRAELESITNAFEEFAREYNAVRIETSSAVSTYATIHKDIYNVAEEKRAALILVPFHKQLNTEGALEIVNNAYRDINLNVLQESPCSVGIFIDRGLGSLLQSRMRIVVLFIGGPDDREALALAWRMARHQGTQLSLVRILLFGEETEIEKKSAGGDADGLLDMVMDSVMQKELDDEYMCSFRHKAVNCDESIVYTEKEVHTGEEIPLLISELDKSEYDLYIVGQGRGRNSPVLSRLLAWCDNPELGVIGDIVASDSFGTRSSLLVVQQYGSGTKAGGTNTQNPNVCPKTKEGFEMLTVRTE